MFSGEANGGDGEGCDWCGKKPYRSGAVLSRFELNQPWTLGSAGSIPISCFAEGVRSERMSVKRKPTRDSKVAISEQSEQSPNRTKLESSPFHA